MRRLSIASSSSARSASRSGRSTVSTCPTSSPCRRTRSSACSMSGRRQWRLDPDEKIRRRARDHRPEPRDARARRRGSPTCTIPSSSIGSPRSTGRRWCCAAPQDGFVIADYAESYARLIPGARLETIAEAGHFAASRAAGSAGREHRALRRRIRRRCDEGLAFLRRRLSVPAAGGGLQLGARVAAEPGL